MSSEQIGNVSFTRWLAFLQGNMPGLHGLRGVAILLVVWHNVGTTGDRALSSAIVKLYQLFLNAGWIGVQLFFVLSSFLITGILLDGKGRKKQIGHFYCRRALRIFPLYYAVLALTFILLPATGYSLEVSADALQQQIWYWLYLNNWTNPFASAGVFPHFWSLAIEEQFYLLWPVVIVFLPQRRVVVVCLFLVISALLSRYILITCCPEVAKKAAYTFTIVRCDALALGAVLAIMVREQRWFAWLRRYSGVLLAVTSTLVVTQIVLHNNFAAVGAGSIFLNQTIIALWFALAIFLSIAPATSWLLIHYHNLLKLSLLKILAKYSYAIYVFHLPVLKLWFATFAVDTKGLDGIKFLLVVNYNCLMVLAISSIFAFISWHILEQPILRLKRFFPKKPKPVDA